MNRPTMALLPLVLTIGLHSPLAFAEEDSASQLATINKIIRGEGKPGETAYIRHCSQHGLITRIMLSE